MFLVIGVVGVFGVALVSSKFSCLARIVVETSMR
jgi:hypothetical protein